MSPIAKVISVIVVLVILYVIYLVIKMLLFPALIILAIAFIIYKFSGHNIFTGKNKNDEKKD